MVGEWELARDLNWNMGGGVEKDGVKWVTVRMQINPGSAPSTDAPELQSAYAPSCRRLGTHLSYMVFVSDLWSKR